MCIARIRSGVQVIGGSSAQYVITHSRMLLIPRQCKQHIDMGIETNHRASRLWSNHDMTTYVAKGCQDHVKPREILGTEILSGRCSGDIQNA